MKFDTRHASHPTTIEGADTARLRKMFHVGGIFVADEVSLTFSHVERMIVGGVMPVTRSIELNEVPDLNKGPFLARRELGIINVGGPGKVSVDGKVTALAAREGLYVPMGTTALSFSSDAAATPAKYYLASTPAHARYETVKIDIAKANPMPVGAPATANERTIYQYINPDICKSAQLLMGLTSLKEGSVWNTMPCHLHGRRSEIYFYYGLPADGRDVSAGAGQCLGDGTPQPGVGAGDGRDAATQVEARVHRSTFIGTQATSLYSWFSPPIAQMKL